MTAVLTGVTGGIGSGKSVVCRICALAGVPVYDCDTRAKDLMRGDARLKHFIISEVGEAAYTPDESLDTAYISRRIFADHIIRRRIEAKVHHAVREDIDLWRMQNCHDAPLALVESAILHTSGLDAVVDAIWLVDAPLHIRMERVKARSALSEEQILQRIAAQQQEFDNLPSDKMLRVDNSGNTPLLPSIEALLIRAGLDIKQQF